MAAQEHAEVHSVSRTDSNEFALSSPSSLGEEFLAALTERDPKRLEACFNPKARLRALVPTGPQEHTGSSRIAEVFTSWFAAAQSLRLLDRSVDSVSDRLHVRYRFRELYADGESELIEQNGFCSLSQGQILTMDLVCSGRRPEAPATDGRVHRFDAGELGCGSGLPEEFRRQVGSIPVGSTLEIVARDPSAKEDLPSLARLLGHRVLSVTTGPEGVTVISILRAR